MISVIATARTTTINLKNYVRTFHNNDDYNQNKKNKNVVISLIEKNYHYNTIKSILCIVIACCPYLSIMASTIKFILLLVTIGPE